MTKTWTVSIPNGSDGEPWSETKGVARLAPRHGFDEDGHNVVEADGMAWLAARPSLLRWPRDIVWVLAPPLGGQWRMADLWGLDTAGELILVEGKRLRKNVTACDPFTPLAKRADEVSQHWTAEKIREHWDEAWALEQKRWRPGRDKLETGRTIPGVLPYGSKRVHWGRWTKLYAEVTDFLMKSDYAKKVRTRLDMREESSNPVPHFFGYIVLPDTTKEPGLTKAALAAAEKLMKRSKDQYPHVHVVSAGVTKANQSEVDLTCKAIGLPPRR